MRCWIAGLVLCFALCGCTTLDRRTIPVVTQSPIVALPERPVLASLTPQELEEYNSLSPSTREKLQNNDKELKKYAEKLQTAIIEINGWSKYNNQKANEWGGVK